MPSAGKFFIQDVYKNELLLSEDEVMVEIFGEEIEKDELLMIHKQFF